MAKTAPAKTAYLAAKPATVWAKLKPKTMGSRGMTLERKNTIAAIIFTHVGFLLIGFLLGFAL